MSWKIFHVLLSTPEPAASAARRPTSIVEVPGRGGIDPAAEADGTGAYS